MKEREIEKVSITDFHQGFKEIASQGETVAIMRNRRVDGYYVPAEVYEALLRNSAKEK